MNTIFTDRAAATACSYCEKDKFSGWIESTGAASISLTFKDVMPQTINGRLQCEECETIYLSIPETALSNSPIFCSDCGAFMGRWSDIKDEFFSQGGRDGIFELRDGQIMRTDLKLLAILGSRSIVRIRTIRVASDSEFVRSRSLPIAATDS
ncbi:hypothetical protein HQ945_08805 [Phyllobacterium sp. BT25]|uniref:Uncharacterized protein n=1 Tax=Phyllobacterium pellucidum TaxID=2740464 RepID=A0A849VN80_9HYPH|nr:hypothetical protein [Phyllobacterium pellucidum]NTS31352.1 hypothetical protein [Phyllobacterium pellucidum]